MRIKDLKDRRIHSKNAKEPTKPSYKCTNSDVNNLKICRITKKAAKKRLIQLLFVNIAHFCLKFQAFSAQQPDGSVSGAFRSLTFWFFTILDVAREPPRPAARVALRFAFLSVPTLTPPVPQDFTTKSL